MTKLAFALAAFGLICSIADGAELPPIAFLSIGFREARLTDFATTPQVKLRVSDPSGFLAVAADFNGDGKTDEARILLNNQRQEAYVVAVIVRPTKVDTYVLANMPLENADNTGIVVAKPVSKNGAISNPGLTIFALDGGNGEANYFDGEEFNIRVPITVDMARM